MGRANQGISNARRYHFLLQTQRAPAPAAGSGPPVARSRPRAGAMKASGGVAAPEATEVQQEGPISTSSSTPALTHWTSLNVAVMAVCLLLIAGIWARVAAQSEFERSQAIDRAVQRNDNLAVAF